MPLALTDPRWNKLRSSYGSTEDVVVLLTQAQVRGLSEEQLGDLVNEVQHQGDTSTAMYAVASHLIELARVSIDAEARTLLIQAGLIYASSTGSRAVVCPEFLRDEFAEYASIGAKMLAPLLPSTKDFDDFKWSVAALAGFLGYHSFARLLDGLDLYEGRFHHVLLDSPFPPEI